MNYATTTELAPGHTLTAGYDATADGTPWLATCECGWRTASASAGLRNWNVDGHIQDIRAQDADEA